MCVIVRCICVCMFWDSVCNCVCVLFGSDPKLNCFAGVSIRFFRLYLLCFIFAFLAILADCAVGYCHISCCQIKYMLPDFVPMHIYIYLVTYLSFDLIFSLDRLVRPIFSFFSRSLASSLSLSAHISFSLSFFFSHFHSLTKTHVPSLSNSRSLCSFQKLFSVLLLANE